MTDILTELQKPNPSAIIELYKLELSQALHGSNEEFRFHAGVNEVGDGGKVRWASQNYARFPIEIEGFEYNGSGQLPRPTLRVSNALRLLSALLVSVNSQTPGNDLIGAKLTRIRTLARFLDAENFPGGTNPYGTPDSGAELPREIYYVSRKTNENKEFVEFELAAAFDLGGVRAPKRQCIQNICQWVYRGAECGYTGSSYFDENDTPLNLVPATNFPAGTNTLAAGSTLVAGQYLTSANGWYQTTLEPNGRLVTMIKDGRRAWSNWSDFSGASTINPPPAPYYLEIANSNVTVRSSSTGGVHWTTAISPTTFGSGTFVDYYPAGIQARGVTLWWELFGEATSAGLTRTLDYTWEFAIRQLTVRYNVTSVTLTSGSFAAERRTYGWNIDPVTPYQVLSATGLWEPSRRFVGWIETSPENPFRETPSGTLFNVGRIYDVTSSSVAAANLVQQNNGELQLLDASNNVLWTSGYVNTNEPLVSSGGGNIEEDVCGKRLKSCELRFGAGVGLPFGSFPGVGQFLQ
jgi:lambda family phage minor tail protein L